MPERQFGYAVTGIILQLRRPVLRLRIAQFAFNIHVVTLVSSLPDPRGPAIEENGVRRLPPLTAVEAFVQVARLGSVKAAAEELALSSPALSRRVQAMERFIGRPLFARRHQSMTLNEDGERLLHRI